jgi:hypothetical protein
MTFYEMLEQVIALLQRHGRVSYRALKVQFELDEDRLDLLKEELLYAQYPIADDNGRGLVWTGAPGGVQEPVSPHPLFAQCFRNSLKILTIVFHNLYPSCQQYVNFQRLKGMGQ